MSIILAPSLVITPVDEIPTHYPIIGWDNQVTTSNIVAEFEEEAYPATNLANPLTAKVWRSSSTAEQLVTASSLSGLTDYVAFARHNLGSTGAIVSVEAITAEPGAVWEEVFAGLLLGDDAPAMLVFSADYYTGVRLRIVPDGTAPTAAVLYVGKALKMPKGLQTGFVPLRDAAVPELVAGLSESGEFLGAIITSQERNTVADFKALDRAWYAENARPFVVASNRGEPFFFASNPADSPDDVGFCWFSGTVRPDLAYLSGDYGNLSLPLKGLAL